MYRSLEKIYSQQVRGNVPTRRHLRVLGEENTEQEVQEVLYTRDKIKEAIDRLELDDTDPEQMKKIYDRIINFPSYRNIKNTLNKKGYNPLILKKFSSQIQSLIEDLTEGDRQEFIDYLASNNQATFPVDVRTGDIYTLLSRSGVPNSAIEKIVKHTAQDEGGKGVGMGELALSLVFDNIHSAGSAKMKAQQEAEQRLVDADWVPRMRKNLYTPAIKAAFADIKKAKEKVKGDLELDGEEFEIKGEGASLGPRPDGVHKSFGGTSKEFFKNYGLTVKGKKYELNENEVGGSLGEYPLALSETYKSLPPVAEEGEKSQRTFREDFRRFLEENGKLEEAVNTPLFSQIDLSNPASIQTGISLMSFYEYANEEGFSNFMAHDIGEAGSDQGKYVFVSGDALQMAENLRDSGVKFQKIAYNRLRPRIGFHGTYSDEEYEEL